MDGRAFLDVARRLVNESTEADWRTAAGRAYYACLLEARSVLLRWKFAIPKGEQVHRFVRLRFTYSPDSDLKSVGLALEKLGTLRNRADYETEKPGSFGTNSQARQAILVAASALDGLDRVDGDPARRAAAVTALHKAFP